MAAAAEILPLFLPTTDFSDRCFFGGATGSSNSSGGGTALRPSATVAASTRASTRNDARMVLPLG